MGWTAVFGVALFQLLLVVFYLEFDDIITL